MISELFLPDLKLIIAKGSLQDKNDFFTALYKKQESWNAPYTNETYLGELSPDRHTGSIKVRDFPMNPKSWVEFEIFVDTAYSIALFIDQWKNNLNAADYAYYLQRAGIYNGPHGPLLIASDGTVLAHGLITPSSFAHDWNLLRVPYERNVIKSNPLFPYIRDLASLGEDPTCFRMSRYQFPEYLP